MLKFRRRSTQNVTLLIRVIEKEGERKTHEKKSHNHNNYETKRCNEEKN